MSERLEPDDPLGRERDRRMAAEGASQRLHAENFDLRTRAEQAEAALAGIADVLNQELRENGGDRFQINRIGEDMRPAIRVLVDCVNRRTEAERDALRAEAGRLREAIELAWKQGTTMAANTTLNKALSSTALSAAAVEQRKAMERAVEAADALEAIIKAELPEDPSMDTDRDAQVRRLCFEVFTAGLVRP